ncbi:hypothetical protein PIIN_10826 [Serendipita indica DSM 11827]|nr:hypothetical protein PIIN_10826 [Serendipita indica DSM 11827]
MIILNSLDAINGMVEKRMSIYSGRPWKMLVNEIMGFGYMMSLASQSPDLAE